MKSKIINLFTKSADDDILLQSAALAFYTSFSLAPLTILFMSILAALNLSLQADLLMEVDKWMGKDAVSVINTIISKSAERADLSTLAGWIGVLGLLFSASAIFSQLQSSLNTILKKGISQSNNNSFWLNTVLLLSRKIFSLVMVLIFILVAMVSLIMSSLLFNFVFAKLGWMGRSLDVIFGLSVFSFLFGFIFKWVPERKIHLRAALCGGFITAILFLIGKFFISNYLIQTAGGSVYGAVGAVIAVLVWVYYSSLIFFFGAEIVDLLSVKISPKKPRNPAV